MLLAFMVPPYSSPLRNRGPRTVNARFHVEVFFLSLGLMPGHNLNREAEIFLGKVLAQFKSSLPTVIGGRSTPSLVRT